MNLYGYADDSRDLLVLKEVTVEANSEEIRKLVEFLLHCADEIDNDESWEHEHLSGFKGDDVDGPEIVIFRKYDATKKAW